MSLRRAFSLVEVLVASSILAVCLTVLFSMSAGSVSEPIPPDARIVARLLAVSILDTARHRLAVSDSRGWTLGSTPAELRTTVLGEGWKAAFKRLAQPRTAVLAPAASNPYFDGVHGARLPGNQTGPWPTLSYEVLVHTDPGNGADGPLPPAAHPYGPKGYDAAGIEVLVYHESAATDRGKLVAARLASVVGAPDLILTPFDEVSP